MKRSILLTTLLVTWCLSVAAQSARPNVLFIAIDDLRNELGVAGSAHARTPNLDKFAASARYFSRHYAIVPTCGASRAALLRGRYPDRPAHLGNNAIRDTHKDWSASMPAWFQKHGYQTLALGKITHYPGGGTGKLWSDGPEELPDAWTRAWIPNSPWKTAEEMMHGYANGKSRAAGKSPPLESVDVSDTAYPDAWVADEAIRQLNNLAAARDPWFFAIGFFKPHLPFAAPKKYFDQHPLENFRSPPPSHSASIAKHGSGEFRGNYGHNGRDPETDLEYAAELRRAYAAAISYVDAQVGRTLDAFEKMSAATNTVVVIWGDHGFLLGEHGVWGKHCLYEDALRSPLIIRAPGMKEPGKASSAIVEAVDLFPTLADLAGLPQPPDLHGRTLRAHLENPALASTKPANGFWNNGQQAIRTERWRLISYPATGDAQKPAVELFNHQPGADSLRNVAATHPEIVQTLLAQLPSPVKPSGRARAETPRAETLRKMKSAARYFAETVAAHGGYVYVYTADLTRRWGEGEASPNTIFVQPPGTPTVGQAFLTAYEATGDRYYLDAAIRAADALVYGQLESGGWTQVIHFQPPESGRFGKYRNGKGGSWNASSLDDGQTQSALQFLMRMDKALKFEHARIHEAATYGLNRLLAAQFENGGFPQVWTGPAVHASIKKASHPAHEWRTEGKLKNYWDYYTLNDGLAGTVCDTLIAAHSIYKKPQATAALRKLGDFLLLAQMPDPQPAWCQQYNYDMEPIWARRFEPPAITGSESQDAMLALIRIYGQTKDRKYLEPIPRALTYLREKCLLPDGRLARFYELKSNKPLYMTREYELTYDDSNVPTHYAWKVGSRLKQIQNALNRVNDKPKTGDPQLPDETQVRVILDSLDPEGRWVQTVQPGQNVAGSGMPPGARYLSSATFANNLNILSASLRDGHE